MQIEIEHGIEAGGLPLQQGQPLFEETNTVIEIPVFRNGAVDPQKFPVKVFR